MAVIYNNSTKRWSTSSRCSRGIVYINDKYIEFGYFEVNYKCIPIRLPNTETLYFIQNKECCCIPLYWNNIIGAYVITKRSATMTACSSKHIFNYPIRRAYNLCKLHLEEQPYNIQVDPDFNGLHNLTFGLEYETSSGNIPWLDCLEQNLVPLYDGSINGHEYVTFPLSFKTLPIIKNHIKLLKTYTDYNLDCSLHVHIGGFPILYDKISMLCRCWSYFQKHIIKYIPEFSFNTELYKSNGKAYNKSWEFLSDLKQYYSKYTGNNYSSNKDFYLPNLYDIDEERKWEVSGRYYNMNIMHLISGNSHKTVEFRFLPPTHNYSEIKWYLLVLGAFVNFVINTDTDICYENISLESVLNSTFSPLLVDKIIEQGKKLYALHKIQITNNDPEGFNKELKELYLNLVNFNM